MLTSDDNNMQQAPTSLCLNHPENQQKVKNDNESC